MTVVEAASQSKTFRRAWGDLIDGFSKRELWLHLGWQDIKQKYRRSVLGPFWITIATGTTAIAMGLLFAYNGMISVHFYIAVALGISLTMLLGGGLMGLVFLSNGTGHDESVDNQMPSRDEFWSPKDD